MLTVGSLVSECGLELAAGESNAGNRVRWVHISEHEDPTPWLSGSELLLTTGYNLADAERQRRYVELLADNELAGLGFGVGFDHERMPEALVAAARERELPLFEVPYEMPFIAITERAAARLVNEQFDVLDGARHGGAGAGCARGAGGGGGGAVRRRDRRGHRRCRPGPGRRRPRARPSPSEGWP
jgi:purine catabolism regulator